MALNFPDSPTDGQVYEGFYWDNTVGVWQQIGSSDLTLAANFSNTATGTYTDGFDYKYVSFTASGSLTVTRGGYADILVIGGGGAGATGGGGGGAGGCLYATNVFIPAGSHDVVVGAGGSTRAANTNYIPGTGDNGTASSIGGFLYSPGGGGGISRVYHYDSSNEEAMPGLSGGSGGGSAGGKTDIRLGGAGGSGISGLGNDGGDSFSGGSGNFSSGGGGGAGAAGDDGSLNDGGNGGNGVANSITGTAVTYAGGGGGCGFNTNTHGTGGSGGGGDAGNATGTSGTANTGGGGGASFQTGENSAGGAGGSGIVVVRVKTNS